MKRLPLVLSLLGVFVVLVSASTAAQSRPNFTGTWRADLAKSDFGPSQAPDAVTVVIEHKGATIATKSTQSAAGTEITNQRTLTTDGKPSQNTIQGMGNDQTIISTSKWDGAKLVTTYSIDLGIRADVVETWELSADGAVFTNTRQVTVPEQSFTIKVLFNKSK